DLAHPRRVAAGEVIIDRHDMDALAGERVQIDRERRHQRLAFAGLHLGDVALVQHHAADQLHVEMALAEGALGRLAHRGEGRNQDVVERLTLRELFAELLGAGLQRFVGESSDFRLQRIDGIDAGLISLYPPVIGGAEKLAGERADHAFYVLFSRLTRGSGLVLEPFVAYQLTVTRRSTVPDLKGAVREWVGIEHFWVQRQKTQQK